MMTLHKLTAGTGYEYFTRNVAAMDSTEKGHMSLADYYSLKGEKPGRWVGSGPRQHRRSGGRRRRDRPTRCCRCSDSATTRWPPNGSPRSPAPPTATSGTRCSSASVTASTRA